MVPLPFFVCCNASALSPLTPTAVVSTFEALRSYNARTFRMPGFEIEYQLATLFVLQTRNSHRREIFLLMRVWSYFKHTPPLPTWRPNRSARNCSRIVSMIRLPGRFALSARLFEDDMP